VGGVGDRDQCKRVVRVGTIEVVRARGKSAVCHSCDIRNHDQKQCLNFKLELRLAEIKIEK
jgi:hypothetical protein